EQPVDRVAPGTADRSWVGPPVVGRARRGRGRRGGAAADDLGAATVASLRRCVGGRGAIAAARRGGHDDAGDGHDGDERGEPAGDSSPHGRTVSRTGVTTTVTVERRSPCA